MTFHCVHTCTTYLSICFLQNNHNCDDQKTVVIVVILFECVIQLVHPGIIIATTLFDLCRDVIYSQVQRLNKCRQPTHALNSTLSALQCRWVRRDNRRLACTNNTLAQCPQTLVFCRCGHAEYNNNTALKIP